MVISSRVAQSDHMPRSTDFPSKLPPNRCILFHSVLFFFLPSYSLLFLHIPHCYTPPLFLFSSTSLDSPAFSFICCLPLLSSSIPFHFPWPSSSASSLFFSRLDSFSSYSLFLSNPLSSSFFLSLPLSSSLFMKLINSSKHRQTGAPGKVPPILKNRTYRKQLVS